MTTTFPTSLDPTILIRDLVSMTSIPSKPKITSPERIPASLAGPFGTLVTKAPTTSSNPRDSAMSSEIS